LFQKLWEQGALSLPSKIFLFGIFEGLFSFLSFLLNTKAQVEEYLLFANTFDWVFIHLLYTKYTLIVTSWIQALGSFNTDGAHKLATFIWVAVLVYLAGSFSLAVTATFVQENNLFLAFYIYFLVGLLLASGAFWVIGISFHLKVRKLPKESEIRKKKLKVCSLLPKYLRQ